MPTLEELVGPLEVHADAPSHGGMAEGSGYEGLADPDRSERQHVVGVLHEAKRGQLRPQSTVVADLGGIVLGLENHGGVQVGGPGPQPGRGAVPAVDLVGQHELQELGVAQVCRAKASRSARVSRLRPSFKQRSSDHSSVETLVRRRRPSALTSPDGELAWVSGKTAGHKLALWGRRHAPIANGSGRSQLDDRELDGGASSSTPTALAKSLSSRVGLLRTTFVGRQQTGCAGPLVVFLDLNGGNGARVHLKSTMPSLLFLLSSARVERDGPCSTATNASCFVWAIAAGRCSRGS